jgi:hypothetical protein
MKVVIRFPDFYSLYVTAYKILKLWTWLSQIVFFGLVPTDRPIQFIWRTIRTRVFTIGKEELARNARWRVAHEIHNKTHAQFSPTTKKRQRNRHKVKDGRTRVWVDEQCPMPRFGGRLWRAINDHREIAITNGSFGYVKPTGIGRPLVPTARVRVCRFAVRTARGPTRETFEILQLLYAYHTGSARVQCAITNWLYT